MVRVVSRRLDLDFCKGMLILFVVWGHVCSYISGSDYERNVLTSVIRLYQMPMFIMVSGYFQRPSLSWQDIKNKVIRIFCGLCIPYLVWITIASFVELAAATYAGGWRSLITQAGLLWYLGCLILCELFYALVSFLHRRFGNIVYSISVMLMLILPNDIFHFSFLWPFFLLGVILRNERVERLAEKIVKEKLWIVVFVCLMLLVIAQFFPTQYTFYNKTNYLFCDGKHKLIEQLVFVVVRYSIYTIVTIAYYLLFRGLYHITHASGTTQMVCCIGQKTLGIFVIHIIGLYYFLRPVVISLTDSTGLLTNTLFLRYYVLAVILAGVSVVVSYYITILTEKSRIVSILLWGKH